MTAPATPPPVVLGTDVPGSVPLLDVRALRVWFPVREGVLRRVTGWIRAVDGATFSIAPGTALGLVGESGSGKTTIGRTVVRLQRPTEGRVFLDGIDLTGLEGARLRRQRHRFQMIFQDSAASLDPRQPVGSVLGEALATHGLAEGRRAERVGELLDHVGLERRQAARYPHELSGGQRQRVGIARAIAVEPELLVCDEPLSALDVSIQSQILDLLIRLQHELGLTYLFISHDLAVVRQLCDRVAVMYLGRLVEVGRADDLFDSPGHPYTVALLSAVPSPDPEVERSRDSISLQGDVPSPADPPSGCHFHPRCWLRRALGSPEVCETTDPALVPAAGPDHAVACHFADRTGTEAHRWATATAQGRVIDGTDPVAASSAAAPSAASPPIAPPPAAPPPVTAPRVAPPVSAP
jgi:oligopeptide/dipeptide ABC transporter ATP-binding protein